MFPSFVRSRPLLLLSALTSSLLSFGVAGAEGWPEIEFKGADVTYQVAGKDYEGYYRKVENSEQTLLVLHDWNGLNEYEKIRVEMLANEGFSVFAADLFGKGVRPTKDEDKRQHTGELYQDRKKLRSLMEGALAEAKKLGLPVKTASVLGYCFGGAAALDLVRSGRELKFAFSFHGGLATPEGQDYSKAQARVVVFHGTADTAITMGDFSGLAEELEKAKVAHEMITYGAAPHSFTHFGSDRYQEFADKSSWRRTLEILKM